MVFRPRTKLRTALFALLFVLIVGFFINLRHSLNQDDNVPGSRYDDAASREQQLSQTEPSRANDKAFVVASQKGDDTDWLFEHFPGWSKYIYNVDDPTAALTVPKNKGRESMVYLTYIIDHYDNLPQYILFLHPKRYQWHNDDPDYDGLPVLQNFQLPYLHSQGYVNLRCAWVLGCPSEIKPYEKDDISTHQQAHAGHYYKKAFQEIFGVEREVPEMVGVSCCAQFAVTREKVRETSRGEWERLRRWLVETELTDDISGRVLEYSWHMLFGKNAVHCPSAADCYCNVFGLCDLECDTQQEGMCKGRYTLPPYSSLPEGWPYVGWDGGPRQRAIEVDL
ncbi:hypothetical protein K490DRAFT_73836 [Saccharata proteae CBS 121410]|uniref:Uncharacterized protein n=1 Tax=Saccharata proteae CBS 121410 TaxID=1314787 RepID=A0A9P4HT22_9PEZI|nr:hypothetical protein K490DRAFT_73836 [Saccharata proteae CBS 121410]